MSVAFSAFAERPDKVNANYPESEIFLFDLDLSNAENVLSNVQNVTRREGYDNQPYFTKDSKSFIFSRGDDYQTDVYEYFLENDETKRLTHSDETEFSPTPFPDNKSISFVSNRNSSIWYETREKIDTPRWAQRSNNNQEPVGYYAWNHETGDILYWSQYGFSVTLVHESSEDRFFVSGHAIPSTPHIIPGTNKFSFVHRQTNGQVWIKEFDPETRSTRPITATLGTNANYAWVSDGSLLMIERDVLYRWRAATGIGWEPVADLLKHGVKTANRLAISPDGTKLAVVGLEG
jgi:Tol biopolymer transport system component